MVDCRDDEEGDMIWKYIKIRYRIWRINKQLDKLLKKNKKGRKK
jgi:hypothetical protein